MATSPDVRPLTLEDVLRMLRPHWPVAPWERLAPPFKISSMDHIESLSNVFTWMYRRQAHGLLTRDALARCCYRIMLDAIE